MYNHQNLVVIDPSELVPGDEYLFSWRTPVKRSHRGHRGQRGQLNLRSGEFVGLETVEYREGYKFKHVKIIPGNRTTHVEFYADADTEDGITFYKDVDLATFIKRVTETAGVPAAGGGKKTKRSRKFRHNRKTKRSRKFRHNRKTRYH